MGFNTIPLYMNQVGKKVSGLNVTNPEGLTLAVSSGTIKVWKTGNDYELTTPQSYDFAPHQKWRKICFMGIVSDGNTTDLWVDEFIHDGITIAADPPGNFELILTLAWFELSPGETDFSNTEVTKRIYI